MKILFPVLASMIIFVKLLLCFIDTINNNLWKTNPVTETRYQINSESLLTWHQARRSCQQQNAELLSITDLREEMYLLGKVKKPHKLMHMFKMYVSSKSFNMVTCIYLVQIGLSDILKKACPFLTKKLLK